jgi:hypothetical protein
MCKTNGAGDLFKAGFQNGFPLVENFPISAFQQTGLMVENQLGRCPGG